MGYKLRVSKAGYNTLTEATLDNIIYDSDYDTLKYYAEGVASIVVSKSIADPPYTVTTFVQHDLGYYPFNEVVVEHDGSGIWRMIGTAWVTAGFPYGVFRKFESWVTDSRLYFKIRGDTGDATDSYTANFRYKIYRNDLGL